MKFIPGSKFINNTPKNGKYFKRGIIYKLRCIQPMENKIKYVFENNINNQTEIIFESVKQADNFLDIYCIY